MPETCCSCSSICRDQKLYSWVLPWNWEFRCSCFFFVSGTDFKGILYLFTFCIHDRENASSCFSSCLWNGCWRDCFIFFTLIFYFLHKKSADSLPKSTLSASKRSVFHELLSLGIPLTLNSFSVTLLQSVQSILIPMMLYRFYGNRYRSVEIYGILSGMALPFIMFPSTITNALSLMLLPKISAAKTHNDPSYLRRCAILPLIFCTFLGIGAFGGFFVFGPWIGNFFFMILFAESI